MNIDQLMKVGGSEWQKNGLHRIYFSDLAGWYGLECDYYHSGRISSATFAGETISNSEAYEIAGDLTGKVWYDASDGKFHGVGIRRGYFDEIIAAIKAKAAAVAA